MQFYKKTSYWFDKHREHGLEGRQNFMDDERNDNEQPGKNGQDRPGTIGVKK
jgi:hypothetical protein